MTLARVVVVTGTSAVRGPVNTTIRPLDGGKPEVLVQLDDPEQVLVPFTALNRQEDDSDTLSLGPAGF
jgi:hypothetical protein